MNTSSDISYELLVDLAEGLLSPTDERSLRARVAANPHSVAELARLEALITLMRQDTSEDAPHHVVNRAQRIFQATTPSTTPPSTGQNMLHAGVAALHRLIAVLQFDSLQAPQAYGVRQGVGWPGVQQLLYSADMYDLDLRIVLQDNQWQISGQVLGADDDASIVGTVELSGAAIQSSVPLNDLGEFLLPLVPAGSYRLTVRMPDLEITIPLLEVGLSQT